jgi:hypothetical protein
MEMYKKYKSVQMTTFQKWWWDDKIPPQAKLQWSNIAFKVDCPIARNAQKNQIKQRRGEKMYIFSFFEGDGSDNGTL